MRAINQPQNKRGLLRSVEGAATVEYTVVMVFVSISAAAAIVGVGVPLLAYFRYAQMIISVPFP